MKAFTSRIVDDNDESYHSYEKYSGYSFPGLENLMLGKD